MKRFFYAIIAVVAALGFAACEKDSTEITEGALSFYATIEGGDSRIAMSQTGDVWNSTWEGDESLTVTPNFDSYFVFTNTADNPNRFSCTMAGVEALKSAEKVYVFNSQALNSVNSTIGADGMFLYAETAWAENITLVASAAMLHYSSEYYVTLTAQDMFGDGNSGRLSEVTLAAGESVFVPIFAGKATLSYSIAGKVCKSMELDAKAGVVYELGTLAPAGDTPTPDPTPDPAGNTLYLVPNADWSASGAWFAAYYWDTAGGNGSVKFTDDNADGIYEGVLPSTAEGMLFCRMNPAYPEFGWNSETETDRVWNQTGDLTVGVAPNNYFYITGWDSGEWNVAGYVPEVPAQSFSLAGSFNSWGDLVMTHSEFIAFDMFQFGCDLVHFCVEIGNRDFFFGGNLLKEIAIQFQFFVVGRIRMLLSAKSGSQDHDPDSGSFRFVQNGSDVLFVIGQFHAAFAVAHIIDTAAQKHDCCFFPDHIPIQTAEHIV